MRIFSSYPATRPAILILVNSYQSTKSAARRQLSLCVRNPSLCATALLCATARDSYARLSKSQTGGALLQISSIPAYILSLRTRWSLCRKAPNLTLQRICSPCFWIRAKSFSACPAAATGATSELRRATTNAAPMHYRESSGWSFAAALSFVIRMSAPIPSAIAWSTPTAAAQTGRGSWTA